MKKSTLYSIIAAVIVFLISFLLYLTPLNLHAPSFWCTLILILFILAGPKGLTVTRTASGFTIAGKRPVNMKLGFKNFKPMYIPLIALAIFVIGEISGMPIFHAGRYASILKVEEAVFAEDLAESLSTDSIALMDTASARMLGDREIGSLSNVVSQYNVSGSYTQIDYQGVPMKVSALDYAGFFKWMGNHSSGVPGYVTVNPVTMSADYKSAKEGMIYVPSAYLLEDAARHIRFHYPTAIFGNLHFEIDEEGNPYYVASTYRMTISLFGGQTIDGAILLDPVTGNTERYALADVPRWMDDIYDGDLICTQYNWLGNLQNGYINSLIGKKGCRRVTTYRGADDSEDEDEIPVSDYGYVAKDGDIWIYTGITSVNGDSSNIGFLLANERTGEAHYYNIAGADENSAMAAAEGEVQEKGYQASFPSLINVDNYPTYIMVLKDNSGLVKLYAAVNVEQYNLVTTASTQKECLDKYRRLLGLETGSGEVIPDEILTADSETDITIRDIRYIDVDGNTYIYLISEDEEIFRAKAGTHEEMLLLNEGDSVHIGYTGKEIVTCEKN